MQLIKKYCTSIVLFFGLIVGSVIVLKIYTYNNTSDNAAILDSLNPIVNKEAVYMKTKKDYAYTYLDAASKIENFTYIQTGYNAEGKARKLKFISFGKRLRPKKFLKLITKGQNVCGWNEVTKEEIPNEAFNALNKEKE